MNISFHKKIILLFLCFLASPVFAIENIRVAAGFSMTEQQFFSPILFVSKVKEGKWQLIQKLDNLPYDSIYGLIAKIKCLDDKCIAVGANFDGSWKESIYISSNGFDWNKIQHVANLPKNHSATLKDINCQGKICIAIGMLGTDRPFILRSEDKGKTWAAINKINGVSDDTSINLQSVNFTPNSILIGGNIDVFDLVMLRSDDQGRTWLRVKAIGLPEKVLKLHPTFNSLSCSGENCVAVGDIMEDREGNPLLMTSHDEGRSWSLVQSIGNYPSNYIYDVLWSVSCSENLCVASGRYAPLQRSLYNFPLLFTSKDKGQTWTYVKNIENLPAEFDNAQLEHVNCKGTLCVATGGDNSLNKPLLVVSNDGGDSWSYIDAFASMQAARLDSPYCIQGKCFVVGATPKFGVSHPLIASSTDLKTWTVQETEQPNAKMSTLTDISS